jgi:hypothetical protein
MIVWKTEKASNSNAIWFVGVEEIRINVLAPPGVPVSRCKEREAELLNGVSGWRWAIWGREGPDSWPTIDDEAPDAMREIDTPGVLQILDDRLHEEVWSCLCSQLQTARQFGYDNDGSVVSEDLARAGAVSVSWLSQEILRGFPERVHRLGTDFTWSEANLPAEAPNDPAELLGFASLKEPRPFGFAAGPASQARVLAWIDRRIGTQLRSGWEARKVHARYVWHVWRHTDTYTALCQSCRKQDQDDLSEYGWGNERPADSDPKTEELMLL